MSLNASLTPYEFLRLLVTYGFLLLSVIDSVFVVIASRRGLKDRMGVFPRWLQLHYKYGIWKVNSVKILLSVIIPYPELALSPRLGLLFFYFVHVTASCYKLFVKPARLG